jgi:hypothetical protein
VLASLRPPERPDGADRGGGAKTDGAPDRVVANPRGTGGYGAAVTDFGLSRQTEMADGDRATRIQTSVLVSESKRDGLDFSRSRIDEDVGTRTGYSVGGGSRSSDVKSYGNPILLGGGGNGDWAEARPAVTGAKPASPSYPTYERARADSIGAKAAAIPTTTTAAAAVTSPSTFSNVDEFLSPLAKPSYRRSDDYLDIDRTSRGNSSSSSSIGAASVRAASPGYSRSTVSRSTYDQPRNRDISSPRATTASGYYSGYSDYGIGSSVLGTGSSSSTSNNSSSSINNRSASAQRSSRPSTPGRSYWYR